MLFISISRQVHVAIVMFARVISEYFSILHERANAKGSNIPLKDLIRS